MHDILAYKYIWSSNWFFDQGSDSSFHKSDSTIVTSDGIAYVADAASCRIRKISPSNLLGETVQCQTTISSIVRPSCRTSYNPPVDEHGMRSTSVEGNIYHDYLYRNEFQKSLGFDFIERGLKECVGPPPNDQIDK